MKEYSEYKKVNSNFIIKLPKHWELLRVKHLIDKSAYYPVGDGDHGAIKPKMYKDSGIPYIRVQNLSWTGQLDLSNVVFIDKEVQDKNKKSKLLPGDILIAKTGATVGKLALIPETVKEANTTSSVGKLTVDRNRFTPLYILYCFQSEFIQSQIWMQASQKSAQPGFNIDDLVEFEVYSPKLSEQTKIAQYLDHKTEIIDELIKKKEELIKKLEEQRQAIINEAVTKGLDPSVKMKDSGVEWLGEIPEDWEVSSFKYYIRLKGRLGWKGLKAEEYVEHSEFGFLSTPDIKSHIIDFKSINHITEERYLESPEIMLEVDDVLLVKDGSTLGITNIVRELPIPTTVNSSIGVLRVFDPKILNPEYLFLFLKTSYILSVIDSLKAGQGVPHLFQKDINNFTLILPTINEQRKIVELVNSKIISIEKVINKLTSQIQLLKNYRKSLISEAVTGKVDVRDWEQNSLKK